METKSVGWLVAAGQAAEAAGIAHRMAVQEMARLRRVLEISASIRRTFPGSSLGFLDENL
jgi:hypothetical protein